MTNSQTNPWHSLPAGPDAPEAIYTFVEAVANSRSKYGYDETLGQMMLKRMFLPSLVYPGEYGFIPRTLAPDGEALDVIVLITEPTYPGCVILARPIAIAYVTENENQRDDKIIAVADADSAYAAYHDVGDIPANISESLTRFVRLTGNSLTGWADATTAQYVIREAMAAYDAR